MSTLGFVNICHPDYVNDSSLKLGRQAAQNLTTNGVVLSVVDEIVTDHKQAYHAARRLINEDVDGVVIFYGAFVLCSTVMAMIEEVKKPLLVWGVPMFMDNGLLQTTGSYVAFSMFSGTLNRLGIAHEKLIASPDDARAIEHIRNFAAAAHTAKRLAHTRMGLVGYTSMSIYPGTFDHVMLRHYIGPEVVHFDSYTLINMAEAVDNDACEPIIRQYEQQVVFPPNVTDPMKKRIAKLYIATKQLCETEDLQAITIKCQYEFSKQYGMVPCVPLSMLADNGVVTSCEGDIPCLVSTFMLNSLSGLTATYGDAIHHEGNVLKLSPCGYMPFSQGCTGMKPVRLSDYPGFKGIMCSFVMHPGKVTMARLAEDIGGYHLLHFTGTGLESRLRGGNMPSLDVRLDGDINRLVDAYPGQHFAICYGDLTARMKMLANILQVKSETI